MKDTGEEPPPLPHNGVAVRRIILADPLSMPRDDGDVVYYPAMAEIEVQ